MFTLNRRTFLQQSVLLSALGAVGIGSYRLTTAPRTIPINELAVSVPNLPEVFAGYTVLQLNNLRLTADNARQIIDQVNQQQADLLVLTGQLLTGQPEELGAFVKQLRAVDGPLAMFGSQTNASVTLTELAQASIPTFQQTHIAIERDSHLLYLAYASTAPDNIPAENPLLQFAENTTPLPSLTMLKLQQIG